MPRSFLSRAYEADVSYEINQRKTIVGISKANALDVARKTEVERYGGDASRQSMAVAQASRHQLATYLAANPTGVGANKAIGAASTAADALAEGVGGEEQS